MKKRLKNKKQKQYKKNPDKDEATISTMCIGWTDKWTLINRLLMYLLKTVAGWFHPYLPILIDMVQFNQEKELT